LSITVTDYLIRAICVIRLIRVQDFNWGLLNMSAYSNQASCAPADISYSTDLELLNQSRKHTETIIDILYNSVKVKNSNKPRTYRKIARKDYLVVARTYALTGSTKYEVWVSGILT
jgi:hypothetical protein